MKSQLGLLVLILSAQAFAGSINSTQQASLRLEGSLRCEIDDGTTGYIPLYRETALVQLNQAIAIEKTLLKHQSFVSVGRYGHCEEIRKLLNTGNDQSVQLRVAAYTYEAALPGEVRALSESLTLEFKNGQRLNSNQQAHLK